MNKRLLLILLAIILIVGFSFVFKNKNTVSRIEYQTDNAGLDEGGVGSELLHELTIESLRKREFPGSEIVIEQNLESGSNYKRYIASYKSDGLKIYALLTIPNDDAPRGGYPVIVFNHGFIPPDQYRTTERYVAYVDGFARNGFIVFRPDYRGHGNSEGEATGGYGSNAYTIDVLNAISSINKYDGVNAGKIGLWGHSMGGFITLRSMVVRKDIKAGVIWGGVVGSYADLLNNWRRRNSTPPSLPTGARRWRQILVEEFGEPEKNPAFWNSISANSYVTDISGPIQLHHGSSDTSVPVEFSQKLSEQLQAVGKVGELYTYPGDDHDITANFGIAMNRSVEFFNKYLKSPE